MTGGTRTLVSVGLAGFLMGLFVSELRGNLNFEAGRAYERVRWEATIQQFEAACTAWWFRGSNPGFTERAQAHLRQTVRFDRQGEGACAGR